MSQQPAEEWLEMSKHEQDRITARVKEICDTDAVDPRAIRTDKRRHLAEGSRSGLAARLAPHGI